MKLRDYELNFENGGIQVKKGVALLILQTNWEQI